MEGLNNQIGTPELKATAVADVSVTGAAVPLIFKGGKLAETDKKQKGLTQCSVFLVLPCYYLMLFGYFCSLFFTIIGLSIVVPET